MNKNKVLLVFPNTSNEGVAPLAIGILSSIAKDLEFDVKYFETSFYKKSLTATEEREMTGEFKSVDRLISIELLPYQKLIEDFNQLLLDFEPQIVAISANSLEYDFFCRILEEIKFEGKKPFIIVGGVHATISPQEVIENSVVDAICIGEGEEAWEEFLFNFKNSVDIRNIKNLWVKTEETIIKNELRPLTSEDKLWKTKLDESFFDERHFLKPFDGKMYKRGLIELSRGCPYSCNYCVNSTFKEIYKGKGKFFRVRALDSLKERAKELIEKGCEMLQLQDECFFSISYEKLKEFCDWYGTEIRLPLLLQTRPESVTDEKVKLIASLGVPVQISCGVESGSERVLKEICNRNTSIQQIRDAFSIIHKYNIRSNAYVMIGFPTETREEVFSTIDLIRNINPSVSIMSVFYPFHGVPLREYCKNKGYIEGNEKAKTFTDISILKNQPMTPIEIQNIRRVYRLYTTLPEEYFNQIEICEKDYENNKELFNQLVSLSWNFRRK